MPITPRTLISARPHRKSGFARLQGFQRRPALLHSPDLSMTPSRLWVEEIDAEPNETHFELKTRPLSNDEEELC